MAPTVASPSTSAPKRKKNASKKGKKSWRKNVDLDDVEDFLEDQRLEQRLGGEWKVSRSKGQIIVLITRSTVKRMPYDFKRLKKSRQFINASEV